MRFIFQKEFSTYLSSLIAYIVIGVFLTAIGLLLWVFPESNILDYGYADMSSLFVLGPYVMMFLIPAITMRMFSEEIRNGTFETLATRPITDWQIILGKYFAGVVLVVLAIAPTLVYYLSVYQLGNPVGNLDSPGVLGSYIGFLLLGGSFLSIGVFASTLSENQVVSFVISTFLCFFFYEGLGAISGLWDRSAASLVIEEFGMSHHYITMSKGLIDSRNVIYFLSFTAFFLMLARFVTGSRRWI